MKILIGIVVGLALAGVAQAFSAMTMMTGWTVEHENGIEICSDPIVYRDMRIIECP